MGHCNSCSTGPTDVEKDARGKAVSKKGYNIRKIREAEVLKNAATVTRCVAELVAGNLQVRKSGQTITIYWFGKMVYQGLGYTVKVARYNCDWTDELARQARYENARRNKEQRAQVAYRNSTAQIDASFG